MKINSFFFFFEILNISYTRPINETEDFVQNEIDRFGLWVARLAKH